MPPASRPDAQAAEPTSHKKQDKLSPSDAHQGSSIGHISLDSSSQTHLDDLAPILDKIHNSNLTLPEKEGVLNIIKESLEDGSLKELTESLHVSNQLVPLYEKMGTLADQAPEASSFLGLITLGFSLGDEFKSDRTQEFKALLNQSGVSPDLLKDLK